MDWEKITDRFGVVGERMGRGLKRVFGSENERFLRTLEPIVGEVLAHEEWASGLDREAIQAQVRESLPVRAGIAGVEQVVAEAVVGGRHEDRASAEALAQGDELCALLDGQPGRGHQQRTLVGEQHVAGDLEGVLVRDGLGADPAAGADAAALDPHVGALHAGGRDDVAAVDEQVVAHACTSASSAARREAASSSPPSRSAGSQPTPRPRSPTRGITWKWTWNTAWCAGAPLFCSTL